MHYDQAQFGAIELDSTLPCIGIECGHINDWDGDMQKPWIEWYSELIKPSWTPSGATIGFIWQCLYPVILVCFGFVIYEAIRGKVSWMVAMPFVINLIANVIFTPIQFGWRNLPLAALDIVVVWGTILWCMVAAWPHFKWVSIAQVPYLIWVSIATVLQLSITYWNWGR